MCVHILKISKMSTSKNVTSISNIYGGTHRARIFITLIRFYKTLYSNVLLFFSYRIEFLRS